MTKSDVIVLGVGGMGSAACYELARRGHRVLGLERFPLVHDHGSSHGQTRIIRTAYYEHPAYVPLLRRAFARWYDLEQVSGKHLLTSCPCLSLGSRDSRLIRGVRQAADEHRLAVESLGPDELRQRFPQFRCPEDYAGLLEHESGFLYVEDCVRAYIEAAGRLGVDLRADELAMEWSADADGVKVRTTKGTYRADRLVITAGPWAGALLGQHGASLSVMRQVLFWFATEDDSRFRRDRFPLFITETPDGHFYGFPAINTNGLKVARHYGAPELSSPKGVSREVTANDEVPVREFLSAYLPEVSGPVQRGQTCLYTLTPDRHFVIDVHPEYPQVAIAAGFSGHGFKFASVVGEILADLAERGRTDLPIDMFRIARFRK